MDATVPATRRSLRRSVGGQSPSRKATDKENATVDVGSTLAANRKKSRSKSMGPGGLDILKQGNGNRRVVGLRISEYQFMALTFIQSLAAPSRPPPRSILKPTGPFLPEIPPHKKKKDSDLIDLSGTLKTADMTAGKHTIANAAKGDVTISAGSKIALRTEEEQQAAAREREERERRDARRKSLATRRVSFAAEATLHTFHEIEYMQDSTTSTESSRRASSISSQSPAPERPTTPQEQIDKELIDLPDNQRELHQKQHRRSSGAPPLSYNNPDEVTGASAFSDDSEPADAVEEIQADEASDSSSDSDADDGTMMSLDAEEMTSASVMSARSTSTTDDSTLDEALRLAAQTAATQSLGDGENETQEEVIAGFVGWGKKSNTAPRSAVTATASAVASPEKAEDETAAMDMDMDMDMDMTQAVGGIIKRISPSQEDHDGADISMDVTRALGGIIRSQSHALKTEESANASLDDTTMDLTVAIGQIRHPGNGEQEDVEEYEDMSMELSTVIGGLLSVKNRKPTTGRRQTTAPKDNTAVEDAPMDMTVPVGRIPPSSINGNDEDGDTTMGMDMTMPIGGIVNAPSLSRAAAKKVMEEEVDKPDTPSRSISTSTMSPFKNTVSAAAPASAETSPGPSAFRGKGLRRSNGPQSLTVAKSPPKPSTPSQSLESTSEPIQTPTRAPASLPKSGRSSSTKRAVPTEAKVATPSPAKSLAKTLSVFQKDPATGARTPSVVLTPQRRRLSGLGADRTGLGSPRVAAIMDRRGSIGEAAEGFVPGKSRANRIVKFEDPKAIEVEIDRERQDEEDKENRRKILEREADDQEATLNLKEMIDSMTPKKSFKPLKGRKSLHVGSGKGVLGKRPAELDDDEEAEEKDGVKRLKGHQASPVKSIRLQQPPSKAETTGRMTRATRRSLDQGTASTITPTTALSPTKGGTTPKNQGRFRIVEDDHVERTVNFGETTIKDDAELEGDDEEERIHLQDFLNMTSIRFMELTTTKRRHTQAPESFRDGTADEDDMSLERCVVAGACTVPMLELYQHSCRELKKYISEGRRIVREIETETFEENPPLFREYMSATPEFKVLMDNQFKNVKTHARLLSKAMWYEWRMKLQDGLNEGLVRIADGMQSDDKLLEQQQELLDSILPAIVSRYESLVQEHENLELAALELADCDPAELEAARSELVSAEGELERKKRLVEELRQQLQVSENGISALMEKKLEALEEIKAAEKIREECRGWSTNEIAALKGIPQLQAAYCPI
jgi:kinetochore protein Spc7/SPC105